MQQEEQQAEKKSRVVTIVRVRPGLRSEDEPQCIALHNQTTLEIQVGGGKRTERVELALGPETTQRQVFALVQPLVGRAMEGFNVTLLTYGQTGSGKTHTMFGSDWSNIVRQAGEQKQQATFLRSIEQDQNYAGLIPRTVHLLLDQLVQRRRKHIKVYCSFLQLYNEQMADLLEDDPKTAKEQKLLIHQNKQDGIYVEGLNEVLVEDAQQCLQLMRRGQRNRVVRQTQMNAKSSRSHTIFTLLIEEVFPSKKSYRRMKLNLCDLAGSEKIHKGEAMTAAHFEQLRNINLSLTTLGKVIGALASSGRSIPPYRQSKLTRLLQDSLGGNTNTGIIATVAGRASCVEQSLNTLKFLERARQVRGEVVAKVYSDNPEMRNLEREISYLRDMLKMRGGHLPTDIELREKYKHLQAENERLKEMVDQGLLDRLQRENGHLRQQLLYQKTDALSDSFIQHNTTFQQHSNSFPQQPAHFRTLDQDDTERAPSDVPSEPALHSISSTDNAHKLKPNIQVKREDSRSRAAKSDQASIKNSTFQRGTGFSIFPSVGRTGPKATSKILDRIMEIEKAKQENRLRLEKELELLEKRSSGDREDPKGRTIKKY